MNGEARKEEGRGGKRTEGHGPQQGTNRGPHSYSRQPESEGSAPQSLFFFAQGLRDPWDPVGRHHVPLPHCHRITTLLGDRTAVSDSGRLPALIHYKSGHQGLGQAVQTGLSLPSRRKNKLKLKDVCLTFSLLHACTVLSGTLSTLSTLSTRCYVTDCHEQSMCSYRRKGTAAVSSPGKPTVILGRHLGSMARIRRAFPRSRPAVRHTWASTHRFPVQEVAMPRT